MLLSAARRRRSDNVVTFDETLRKGKYRNKECENETRSKDDLKTRRMPVAVGISITDSICELIYSVSGAGLMSNVASVKTSAPL